MSLDFITTDAAGPAYDAETRTINNAAETGQKIGVDNAVRAGVSDMLASKQAQPDPSSYQAPQPVEATPVAPAANTNTAPGGVATPQQATAALESGGNPGASNSQGYIGKYGFGKAALYDAGVYHEAGPGMWNNTDWSAGNFTVPGFAPMNVQQFMANPAAQDAAYQAHQAAMDKQISAMGLTNYIGQTIGGVPITQDTLRGMVHGGGAFGTKQFLESNGQHNPADSNGTTISKFGLAIGMPGGQPAAPQYAGMSPSDAAGATAFATEVQPSALMPGANGSRYDPVLARLAATPGGGTAALGLLEKQGAFDQQNYRRSDTYQRLAMQALAHGDTQTARFYANAGGLQLPENIMSNQGNAVMLGRAATLAHQIYGNDPMQAQQFTNSYLQTGDVTQAFNAAGAPRSNPHYQLSWAQQADGTLKALTFSPQTGQVGTATGTDGQPVTKMPTQPAAVVTAQNRVSMLTSIGVPHDQAVQIVANPGSQMHPATVAAAYNNTYRSISGSIDGIGMDEPTKQAKVASTMDAMFGPTWRSVMQPGATNGNGTPGYTAPQPAAAAGAPTGTGAPALPGAAGPMGTPNHADDAVSQQNARNAVQAGKDPHMVVKRLQDAGVPVPPDLAALVATP